MNTHPVTAIDEHLHREKPEAFATIERIVTEKCSHLFPYFVCYFSSNICHSIYLRASLQKREEWSGGYIENSPNFAAHVFCRSQWYVEHPNQSFSFEPRNGWKVKSKMIARKEADPVKLAEYIVKQLTKIHAANSTN